MKKKKLTWMLALIIALMTTACSNDESIPGSDGNSNGVITFTVTPDYGVKTRAEGISWLPDGKALRCIMEVYNTNGNFVSREVKSITDINTPIAFTLKKESNYKTVVFWADFTTTGSPDADLYYKTDATGGHGLKAITFNPSNTTDFNGEAFYGNITLTNGVAASTNITLTHAVAMVSLKTTTQLKDLQSVKVTYGDASGNTNAPASAFNASDGTCTGATTVTQINKAIDGSQTPNESAPYDFNTFYVFAGAGRTVINMTVEMCSDADGTISKQTINVPNVPIRANYRTNLKGDFAIKPNSFKITCEEGWAELDASGWYAAPDHETKFNDNSSDGTEDNPYIIATADQLAVLAANVNDGTAYENKYFKMTADIDLGNRQWTQIGTSSSNLFKGHFDGNFHSITGLVINNYDYYYTGLFGYCNHYGSSIKNLHVSGKVESNVKKDASLSIKYLPAAGGIVGYLDNVTVENCSFDGRVYCLKGYAGGIGGYCSTPIIKYCKNTGEINGKQAGGIIGYMDGANPGFYVEYCYNTGNITGTEIVGGIGSIMAQGTLKYCYNIGEIKGNGKISAITTGYSSQSLSYCKQSYAMTIKDEKVFSETTWPKTDDEGWKADTGADGTDLNGHWKSLGGWNGGSPTYPKLWWEK